MARICGGDRVGAVSSIIGNQERRLPIIRLNEVGKIFRKLSLWILFSRQLASEEIVVESIEEILKTIHLLSGFETVQFIFPGYKTGYEYKYSAWLEVFRGVHFIA